MRLREGPRARRGRRGQERRLRRFVGLRLRRKPPLILLLHQLEVYLVLVAAEVAGKLGLVVSHGLVLLRGGAFLLDPGEPAFVPNRLPMRRTWVA